ncbi:hypothetical protein TNCV_2449071 [Trichonephila clavipes]|uniref:Uncharacterized protein n=1 Tax=Trichonephila clavipes TaxID=2585209 RepID=A0A8X6SG83_TRICX|nr:hypothetical protein TNCV_2449071 [Trichonephila clavipes]
MEPVSVSRHNRKQVLKNLYGGLRNEKPKAPRFKIGPLLRIVRTKGKDGKRLVNNDRHNTLPLVRHSFQTIQSEPRLNSGDFVPFERGKSDHSASFSNEANTINKAMHFSYPHLR